MWICKWERVRKCGAVGGRVSVFMNSSDLYCLYFPSSSGTVDNAVIILYYLEVFFEV